MSEDFIETRGGRVSLEGGIVRVVNPEGCEIDESVAKELIDAVERLCQGKKRPFLVDGSGLKKMNRSARQVFTGGKARNCLAAQAIIASSPIARGEGRRGALAASFTDSTIRSAKTASPAAK